MDKLIASAIALGLALCLGLTYGGTEPVSAPVDPPRLTAGGLTVGSTGWDAGDHTEHTLKGLQELLQSLEAATPSESTSEGLIVQYAVIQSFIALQIAQLPPEDRKACQGLALELFDMIQNKAKRSTKGEARGI